MTTEKIVLTLIPLDRTPQTVKPKRLGEFKPLDRVTSHGAIVTVIRDPLGKHALLDSAGNSFVDAGHEVWFLESDWVNGKPRELPNEPMRKMVRDLSLNDVILRDGNPIKYRLSGRVDPPLLFVERLHGGGYDFLPITEVVTLLGRVEFSHE